MKARKFAPLFVSMCLCMTVVTSLSAKENPTDLAGKTIDRVLSFEGREYPYKIYLPGGYDGEKRYPVIVSLHGLGGNIENYAGAGLMISAENYIIVTPQAPFPFHGGFSWLAGDSPKKKEQSLEFSEKVIFAALDDAIGTCNGDGDNVFLTGLSQGGYMTYVVGLRNYKRFRGLIPCAGAYSFYKEIIGENLTKAKDIPILQSVGRQDRRDDQGLYPRNVKANKALRELGYDARILTYPIGHTLYPPQLLDINDWIQLQMVERRATADILKDLEKTEGFERLPLILSLAMNDDPKAMEFVETLVREGKSSDEMCAVASGLILNGNQKIADALLKTLLRGEDAQVRKTAIHATGMRAVKGMAEPLLKILEDASQPASLRRAAFHALQKYAEADGHEAMRRYMVIKIADVIEGSQAAAAGIKTGDIILEYNGAKIDTRQALLAAVKAAARKEKVKVVVERRGRRIEFDLKGGTMGVRITPELHFPEKE